MRRVEQLERAAASLVADAVGAQPNARVYLAVANALKTSAPQLYHAADRNKKSPRLQAFKCIEIETGTKRRVDNHPELARAMARAKRSKATS